MPSQEAVCLTVRHTDRSRGDTAATGENGEVVAWPCVVRVIG